MRGGRCEDSPVCPCSWSPQLTPPPQPLCLLPRPQCRPVLLAQCTSDHRSSGQGAGEGGTANISSDAPWPRPSSGQPHLPPGPTMDPLKLKWASGSLPSPPLCAPSLLAFHSGKKTHADAHCGLSIKQRSFPPHPSHPGLQTAETYPHSTDLVCTPRSPKRVLQPLPRGFISRG